MCVWIERLVAEGLSPVVAARLAREHPAPVQAVLTYLSTQHAHGHPSPFRSPGGLRRAIEEAWILDPPAAPAPTPPVDVRAWPEARCACGYAVLTNATDVAALSPCPYCGGALQEVPR